MIKKFGYIFLLLIPAIVYFRWISFKPFTHGDWGFFYKEELREFIYPSIWNALWNLGGVDVLLWRFPMNFLHGFFGNLGFDGNISEKFVVFLPTVVVGFLASFILSRSITKSNIGGLVGAFVFNLNTYYLVSSHILLYSAGAFGVLTMFSFISAIEKKKLLYFLLFVLLLSITLSYDLRVGYITALLSFLYTIFTISTDFIRHKKLLFLKITPYLFLSFILFMLMNLYWVLPQLLAGSLTSNEILDRKLFGNEFLNILYSITQYHPFWTGDKAISFEVQSIKISFWVTPLMAFIGFYLNRKNKIILFFTLTALLGVFLTKQVGLPFTNVYEWLFNNFPGFNAFREASKFYFLVALGYSVLIASFSSSLVNKKFVNKSVKILILFVALFPIILYAVNTKPIITGGIGSIYVPRTIPQEYQVFNEKYGEDKGFYRYLWIPRSSKWASKSSQTPFINFATILDKEWKGLSDQAITNHQLEKYVTKGEIMTTILGEDYFNQLLDNSSVKYLVVPLEDINNEDNFFVYYGGYEREYYIKKLDSLGYLSKTSNGHNDLVVYENANYKPHIYLTKNIESLKDHIKYEEVNYQFNTYSQYRTVLNNVSGQFFLNFTDSFHPKWKVRVGEFSWIDAIVSKDYFVDRSEHINNVAGLNSFYIDSEEICKQWSCIRNPDGSYDIELTLFFLPQAYLYLGGIISLTTLGGILVYFIFVFGKWVNGKRNKK